jgi:hypothetical protein
LTRFNREDVFCGGAARSFVVLARTEGGRQKISSFQGERRNGAKPRYKVFHVEHNENTCRPANCGFNAPFSLFQFFPAGIRGQETNSAQAAA